MVGGSGSVLKLAALDFQGALDSFDLVFIDLDWLLFFRIVLHKQN